MTVDGLHLILCSILLILIGFFTATITTAGITRFYGKQLEQCMEDLPRSQYCEPKSINFAIINKK